MKDVQFLIMLDGSSYKTMYQFMLSELQDWENVTFITDCPEKNRTKKLLLKQKVQKLTRGCLDFLGYEKNNLYSALEQYCPVKKQVVVFFMNGSLYYNPYLTHTLKKYKAKWPNISYVLFYLDFIDNGVCGNANMLREKNVFDSVYTIDQDDAKKYRLPWWPTFYSKNEAYTATKSKQAFYFCGSARGREDILRKCAEETSRRQISGSFDIVVQLGDKDQDQWADNVTIRDTRNYWNYKEVLQKELEADCILDVVQKGQSALSLRPYEAVVYNKKLLTNNRTILDFPFYGTGFMRYFEKPEDIDWDWVKNDEKVCYGYKGEYAPSRLLEHILQSKR